MAGSVLVLGGSGEARRLAVLLVEAGVAVTTSLAGATTAPSRPAGRVRTGGFGGVEGLADWLRREQPACVVDATHPFAAQMSAHAAAACGRVGTPLLRLARPGWSEHPDAPSWTWVDTHEQAARVAAEWAASARAATRPFDQAVLLTVGRQPTPRYVRALARERVIARVAEPRGLAVPHGWLVLGAVGPFTPQDEECLFAEHGVGALVTKDSGGAATAAKLDAARQVGASVIVVRRPTPSPGVASVPDVESAVDWCRRILA